MRALALAAAGLVLLTAAGVEAAIQWSSASGALTTSTTPTTVALSLGAGAAKTRYFSNLALSTNATYVTGAVIGRAGADVVVKDVVRIAVANGTTQTVTLSGPQVSSANVATLAWTVKNGSTTIGTLDLLAATPSLAFSLPTGFTYTTDLRIQLASGAGLNNVPASFSFKVST